MIRATRTCSCTCSPGASSAAWCTWSAGSKCAASTQIGRPRSIGIRSSLRRWIGTLASLDTTTQGTESISPIHPTSVAPLRRQGRPAVPGTVGVAHSSRVSQW